MSEDLGTCVGCNKPIRVGEVVTPWDDEVGHADCKNPAHLGPHDLPDDCPPARLLVGYPAQYVDPIDVILLLTERKKYD